MEEAVQESYVKNKKYYSVKNPKPVNPADYGIPIDDVKGTSLFDLSLLKISWDYCGLYGIEHLNIHGHIFLMDDQGNELVLFYGDEHSPKKVPVDIVNSTITITLEKPQFESPRVSPGMFCLVFYLVVKCDDSQILIADQVKFFDNTTTGAGVVYDHVCWFGFESESVFGPAAVSVKYTIFQCAILAFVGFIIEKIDDDGIDDKYADMIGTIYASFEGRDKSSFKHVLCNSYSRHEFGNYIQMCVFGVPTYSSLFIEPNVTVDGEDFTGNLLEFEPCDSLHDIPYEEVILGQKIRMRMLVKWGHAIHYLPEADLCEWRDRNRREVMEDRNWVHGNQNFVKAKADKFFEKCTKRLKCINLKNFKPIGILPRLEALTNRKWCISGPRSDDNMLVEIFSISVCSYENDLATFNLSGTINVDHAVGKLKMFNRTKKNPQHLHSFEPIPLKSFDHCIRCPHFYMEIDLKVSRGVEFCHGYVGYNFHTVDDWLNRRLCSTLKGKKGFVTVHHTIFDDAVEARLKFILMSSSGNPIKGRAFGTIHGRYGNFRYGTHYEKKFFQSTLFDKDVNDAVKIVDGKIPLSKSAMAVPLNGELVVTAHICVLIQGGCETLKYTYEATFDPKNRGESEILSKKIQGSNLSLSMFVECC